MLETENNETHLVCVVEKGHEGFWTRIFTKDSLHSVDIYFFFTFWWVFHHFLDHQATEAKIVVNDSHQTFLTY